MNSLLTKCDNLFCFSKRKAFKTCVRHHLCFAFITSAFFQVLFRSWNVHCIMYCCEYNTCFKYINKWARRKHAQTQDHVTDVLSQWSLEKRRIRSLYFSFRYVLYKTFHDLCSSSTAVFCFRATLGIDPLLNESTTSMTETMLESFDNKLEGRIYLRSAGSSKNICSSASCQSSLCSKTTS